MAPSLHCLTSATSGPAHVPLHSAEVIFGMRDSDGCIRRFGQHAFIDADLPFVPFPLSALRARGCFFDFYHEIGLRCGSTFLSFSLTDGLYLATQFLWMIYLHAINLLLILLSVLLRRVLQLWFTRRSGASNPQGIFYVSVPGFFYSVSCFCITIPDPSMSFSSRLTGAGLLLLHAHR